MKFVDDKDFVFLNHNMIAVKDKTYLKVSIFTHH